MARFVCVYGGAGQLGLTIVNYFKTKNWKVISIDRAENSSADKSIIINMNDNWQPQQSTHILSEIGSSLKSDRLGAIICVAGGWAGGNASSKDLIATSHLMLSQSVSSSLIASQIAANYLAEGGLLVLTGAKAALTATPGMIGYGLAKAAVFQLTKSLSSNGSGLPLHSKVVCIAPITLDTPSNRTSMPNADFSSWTPLSVLSQELFEWANGEKPVISGSLYEIITTAGKTDFKKIGE